MIIQCKKADLSTVLQEMISVIPSSSLVPILNCFLFTVETDRITIAASDLEIGLTSQIECQSEETLKIAITSQIAYRYCKKYG